MKTLIYNKVLQAVSEVTEIAPADITSHSKTAEIVEARSLLIYYLYREELSPLQIATLSGFTRQCVEATRLRFALKKPFVSSPMVPPSRGGWHHVSSW